VLRWMESMRYAVYILQSQCVSLFNNELASASFGDVAIQALELPPPMFERLIELQNQHNAECYLLFRKHDSLLPFDINVESK
jgi:hypothetical protein